MPSLQWLSLKILEIIIVFQPHHLKVFQASGRAIWVLMNPISHLGILLATIYKVAKMKSKF